MEIIIDKTFFLHKEIPHLHLPRSTKGIYIRTDTEQPQVHLNFRCKRDNRKGPMLCQNKWNYICKLDNRTSDPIWHATTNKHSNSFINSHVIQLNIFATVVYSLDSKKRIQSYKKRKPPKVHSRKKHFERSYTISFKITSFKCAFTEETFWELISCVHHGFL